MPTTNLWCQPFMARLKDVENNTTGKTVATRVVDVEQVLLSFFMVLLDDNNQLWSTTKCKGTKILPPTRTTSSIDEIITANP